MMSFIMMDSLHELAKQETEEVFIGGYCEDVRLVRLKESPK